MSDSESPLPSAQEDEKEIVACLLDHPPLTEDAREAGLSDEHFTNPIYQAAFRQSMGAAGGREEDQTRLAICQAVVDEGIFPAHAVNPELAALSPQCATAYNVKLCAGRVKEAYAKRSLFKIGEDLAKDALSVSTNSTALFRSIEMKIGEIRDASGNVHKADALAELAFNYDHPPPRPVPAVRLADRDLCTARNITNLQAQVKAGKSAALGAIIGAVVRGRFTGGDCLGFESENPDGKALVHLDTEQSRFDHDRLVRRSLTRAGIDSEPPDWLLSYSLAGLSPMECRNLLAVALADAEKRFGGVFLVLVDGIGDLCEDPNDPAKAFALVDELGEMAKVYDCPILTVLHENPGSENGKTRGHLGSHLERKAETNLRLVKDADGVTSMFTEKSRSCHIPRAEGICFRWCDEAQAHVSCGDAATIKADASRRAMEAEADQAFGPTPAPKTYTELVAAIMDELCVSERTAKERVKRWRLAGIVVKTLTEKLRLESA